MADKTQDCWIFPANKRSDHITNVKKKFKLFLAVLSGTTNVGADIVRSRTIQDDLLK